jgi:hypothetical protein
MVELPLAWVTSGITGKRPGKTHFMADILTMKENYLQIISTDGMNNRRCGTDNFYRISNESMCLGSFTAQEESIKKPLIGK